VQEIRKRKVVIDIEMCKGCELCVHYCPRKCLKIGENFNKKGYYYAVFVEEEKCTSCAICANMCPDVAIEVWKEE
jgi:2-oxoglutarate ferredoxin oxidoreductase subunit delta